MEKNLGKHYIENSISEFKKIKKLGDKTFSQIKDEDFFWSPDEDSNSGDHDVHLDTRQQAHRNGDKEQHCREPEQLQQDEAQCSVHACHGAKAFAQILEG